MSSVNLNLDVIPETPPAKRLKTSNAATTTVTAAVAVPTFYSHPAKTGNWFLGIVVRFIPEEGFNMLAVCKAWRTFIMKPSELQICAQRWLNLRCVAIQKAAHKDVEARYIAKIEFTQELDSDYYEVNIDRRKVAWDNERNSLTDDKSIVGSTQAEIINLTLKNHEEFVRKMVRRLANREYPEDAPNKDITFHYPSLPEKVRAAMREYSKRRQTSTASQLSG